MKKLSAVILAIIMMFSMSTVSFANGISTIEETNSIDNYVDYLEDKIEDPETNIFVKMLVKIVLVFVHFGFIKAEDFQDWFENNAPEDKEVNSTNKPDISDKWEDGTELKPYSSQSFPYSKSCTKFEITISDINIIKEHYEDSRNNFPQKYKYIIKAEGSIDNYAFVEYLKYCSFEIIYLSDYSYENRGYALRDYNLDIIDSSITIDENGNFIYYCEQYMIYNDYDSFFIRDIEIMY